MEDSEKGPVVRLLVLASSAAYPGKNLLQSIPEGGASFPSRLLSGESATSATKQFFFFFGLIDLSALEKWWWYPA